MTREPSASQLLLGYTANFPQAQTAALFPEPAHDALNLDGMLTPEERAMRERVRKYMVTEVAPVIAG